MARRKVIVTPMMAYRREAPKTPFLGWGYMAIRKTSTTATSPRLLKYRSCIAGELRGQKFANLKAIQEKFREIAPKCAAQVRGV